MSITPISTPTVQIPSTPVVNTPTPQDPQQQSSTPLLQPFEALPFQRLTTESMGLSNPVNSEDFAALLADIEDKLDKTMKNNKDEKVKSLAAGVGSVLAGLIGTANSMKVLGDALITAQANLDSDKQKLATVQSDLATQQAQSNSLASQISSSQGTVNSLNAKLAGMKPTDKDYAATVQSRDNAVNTLNSLVSQKNVVDAKIASDQQQISSLNADISKQQGILDTDGAAYAGLQISFMATFAQLASNMTFGVSDSKSAELLTSTINGLRLEFIDDVAKQFTSMLEGHADASSLTRQVQFEDQVKDRVKQAAAVLVSGVVDILTALADLTPGLQVGDPGAVLSSSGRLQIQS